MLATGTQEMGDRLDAGYREQADGHWTRCWLQGARRWEID